MEGPENNRGVTYRALETLFTLGNQRDEMKTDISLSMLEVYNERIM